MKYGWTTLFVFLSFFGLTAQEIKSDREVLTYLKEVEWPKAYREQDTILLDRILAEEFQMISADGMVYNKQDEPSYSSFID